MKTHEPERPAWPTTPPIWQTMLSTRWLRLVMVVELLIALAVVLGLWTLRQQTLGSELRNLASLSAAMAAQADGTLDVAEAALRATRDELAGGLLVPGSAETHTLLHARAAALPKFRALTVFDAEGLRVATSGGEPLPGPTVAQRDFFLAARRAIEPVLFVGSPYISPSNGQTALGVSMNWRSTDGAFMGVVALVANPELLDGDFERIAPSPDISLAIYRRDRTLVSDGPGDGTKRLLPASMTDQLWNDAEPERPRLLHLPDGHRRLVAAHPLRRYPLMVVITRPVGSALDDWNDQAWLVGSFAASALLVTLLLTLRYGREQALRRASEAALATEQARAVRAFQAAQEGHWEWCPATGQTHMSPRMKELLGLARDASLDDAGGPMARASLHPDDVQPLHEAFQAHQEGRSPSFDHTFRVRHGDGRWHHVRSRGQAWRDAAGAAQLLSGTAADVSEEVEGREQRHQLEDQLQRARKLEALGTLAGGVAHDFNNILASVIGYGELARDAATEGSAQARQIDRVLQAGLRGKALVERILSFSRGTPRARSTFLLQPVIDEVLQLLAASLPPQVVLDRQLHAPDAAISGDSTLIYEAAMNLCTNAMQAMPGGGTLRVEVRTEQLDKPRRLFETTLAPGRYVCLTVTDSGAGIAPDVMARLFEPFFTTRTTMHGPHRGTGLGLAVVHGVVTDLGGGIEVRSTPGRGACFTLYFPCVEAPDSGPGSLTCRTSATAPATTARTAACAEAALPLGQGQTILVVDDEPALVELAEELLAGLGYEPFGLSASPEALERFKAEPDRFDLVLTDEVMPGLTGTALAAALHALRPALPIVLASGYGGPQLEQRAAAAGVTATVKKPLGRAELARAIARALQAGPAAPAP
jgi:PAS domain S-box-containing protein